MTEVVGHLRVFSSRTRPGGRTQENPGNRSCKSNQPSEVTKSLLIFQILKNHKYLGLPHVTYGPPVCILQSPYIFPSEIQTVVYGLTR